MLNFYYYREKNMKIKIEDMRLHAFDLMPDEGDAGIDLYACINDPCAIFPNDVIAVQSGIKVAIPSGYVGLVVPRSSTGSIGIHLANSTGIIDSGYRGEIIMKMRNISNNRVVISPLDRIAQLVIVPYFDYTKLTLADELDETARGENGFGSTGK